MMMVRMKIIILIFKACLLVPLCMSGIRSHRASFEGMETLVSLLPQLEMCDLVSQVPTPASPCHAALEEAAK